MDISFCHHRVPFVDKLLGLLDLYLTLNLYLAVSLPFPQGWSFNNNTIQVYSKRQHL